jgi:translation initiation factor IF-2
MTDKENNKSNRSTLTLKLKPAENNDNSEAKTLKLKSTIEVKPVRSSLVQVTIKGRKKDNSKLQKNQNLLDKEILDEKLKVISSSKKTFEVEVDATRILQEKIKEDKQKKLTLKKSKKESVEEVKNLDLENVKEEKSEKILPQIEENNKELKSKSDEVVNIKSSNEDFFKNDNFDVLNKLKQSVAISKKDQEEKEKILNEKRRIEKERLEKEVKEKQEKEGLERDKKNKNKKNSDKFFDEEEGFSKKPKTPIKDEKVNLRKLTYVIDGDDEDNFYRRRKQKNKIINNPAKDYKKIIREVLLPELITVADLADRMSEKTSDVVKKLFTMGMVATSNQVIDADTAELIIDEFGHKVKRVSSSDVENVLEQEESDLEKTSRPPIVTIMGHVDHGKTSLLDSIRKTDVVSKESGGITQHIGASRVKTASGKYITFLDTPGHEAFTEMRSRGANATDIVVLVVAADDGVKEQTIEAISHAKAANAPMIVAVNKIDKPNSDPSRVKNELLGHNIVSEEMGGDIMFVEVSAKNKINLDKLEEAILLQAEILDLKAPFAGKSSGVVIESRIDGAKGVVASLLVLQGTLDVSDLIVVGTSYGKIRKMVDDHGNEILSATPSMAVEVMGLNIAPNAGDKFVEVDEERQAREIISYRSRKEKESKAMKNSVRNLNDIFKNSAKGGVKYLNVIIKADVNGSVEALQGSILKLNNEEVAIKVIHSATGGITETDISLADVSNAVIIGFNVRANNQAAELAKLKNIELKYYSIIYNVVDDLKLLLSGMLDSKKSEEYLGKAEVRQIFKISAVSSKICGSSVIDGIIKKNAKVRLIRDNVVIYEGSLKTLKRFKEDVKEVKTGFECGIAIDNFDDVKEKDIIECYEIVEQKRSL